jgi:D-amino-acid dehydrogenase
MADRVLVLGGGIIGLSTAWFLKEAGHQVTLIDRSRLIDGCSFGNAGMIVPSHFIPLAAPGMVEKGVRWMFNSRSPFFVRPRLSSDLIKWGLNFLRHANQEHVEKSAPSLKALSLLSKKIYQDWNQSMNFDFGYQERGLLMLFKDQHTGDEEAATAEMANQIGIEARLLNAVQVQALEPDVRLDALGGVYFPGDAHLTPRILVEHLIKELRESGVVIHESTEVTGFKVDQQKIRAIESTAGQIEFDQVVLAAGSWSGLLAKALRINLPMQAGKGYSFTLENVEKNIRVPSIFLEARVAVTPMGNNLRFGGTMEIVGVDERINMNRVQGIVDSIPHYYPDLKISMPAADKIWHGLRPCSPDGLPYIGRSGVLKNLVFATGHAMMGLSLAPATGKLVAELVDDQQTTIPIHAFAPERFN